MKKAANVASSGEPAPGYEAIDGQYGVSAGKEGSMGNQSVELLSFAAKADEPDIGDYNP